MLTVHHWRAICWQYTTGGLYDDNTSLVGYMLTVHHGWAICWQCITGGLYVDNTRHTVMYGAGHLKRVTCWCIRGTAYAVWSSTPVKDHVTSKPVLHNKWVSNHLCNNLKPKQSHCVWTCANMLSQSFGKPSLLKCSRNFLLCHFN